MPADVEVRRPPAPVGHREDVVGGQQPERRQRDGDAEDDAGDDVGRVVLGQVEPGERGDGQQRADHPLARSCGTGPAGTSEYRLLTRNAASTVIGRDGMENPAHRPMSSTS